MLRKTRLNASEKTVEITEIRIKLLEKSQSRLRAFCSVIFDACFVVRDVKIIKGDNGPFVAMPSKKMTANCVKCGSKNFVCARFCSYCGVRNPTTDINVRKPFKQYSDIAHPVNPAFRNMIQERIILEYTKERRLAELPGYQWR